MILATNVRFTNTNKLCYNSKVYYHTFLRLNAANVFNSKGKGRDRLYFLSSLSLFHAPFSPI